MLHKEPLINLFSKIKYLFSSCRDTGVSVIVHFTIMVKHILLISCLPSVEHIVGNLVMQLVLGIPLELVHKGFEVGMVYLAGVLAGEHHLYPPSPP